MTKVEIRDNLREERHIRIKGDFIRVKLKEGKINAESSYLRSSVGRGDDDKEQSLKCKNVVRDRSHRLK